MGEPDSRSKTPVPAGLSVPLLLPVIYALGSNGSGQLGLGHTEDVARAEKCLFRPLQKDIPSHPSGIRCEVGLKKIVAGGNHSVLLMNDSRVFVAGHFPGSEENSSVDFLEREFKFDERYGGVITDVAATWEATFVVVDQRAIFGCGKGEKGELGLGMDVVQAEQMTRVFDVDDLDLRPGGGGCKIIAIAASMAHVVVLLSNGQVLGWGSCRKGQLGEEVKKEKVLWKPARIDVSNDGVRMLPFAPDGVALGREYTVFIKRGQRPVIWGVTKSFNDGELEQVVHEDDVLLSGWSSIHVLSAPTQIGCLVRSMGRNDRGQLAPSNLPPIHALAAGSEHCVALHSDNQIIAWGWGEHGNCGEELDAKGNVVGRWNVIPLPRLLEGTSVKSVAAGCATSFVVCQGDG
ncbi:uncharacterized protein Z518_08340 [Rhinocladiella mackenziei CBS 650.93]|uniref:Alpha-tubulin suppressor protein Aats1 n=1 Tax=Rhinocladiella mackenziei CBS 650.93 TaxID=1442369 RepID=A0A0D2I995_9EURO|nr:uncharacterized protein Z518_08340 [Rhinocladiella mackenziei CBS 650.93]KIX02399.1 hypothetical protein Z518_08340 [Rhinocladiella mackenziei CBS 650.93]